MIMFCDNCKARVRTENYENKTCCTYCGCFLEENYFVEEVAFVKTANGQTRMSGSFVRSESYSSQQRTLDDAYDGISSMMYALGIDGGEDIAQFALRLYKMALEKNFTRGRRKELVIAVCLYITCRDKKRPYLLIDFSEHLRINVYVLGATFLQLCKVFSLDQHPLLQKLVDPSLFIHRFASRLFGAKNGDVSKTALLIVASMKRDWMQTGRKPTGICGAALYVAALAYGLNCSKSEIIKEVHICEATLTKRLIEFENTESGGLTIEEFEKKSKEFADQAKKCGEDKPQMKPLKTSESGELLCLHKGSGTPHFSYGLCEECYKEFMIVSGGFNGGSEPPAFQHAQRKRTMAPDITKLSNSDEERSTKNTNESIDDSDLSFEESESLSDIDDDEVDACILDEKEKIYKTAVWEEINKEYIEEQKEKEAANKAYSNCSDGARKLAAAQNRKEKRQKRNAELNKHGPPKTAAEATKQMLERKGLSSRFRQDKMDELFGLLEHDIPSADSEHDIPSAKRSRIEPEHNEEDEDEDEDEEYHELDGNGEAYFDYTEECNYDEDYNDMDDDIF